MATQGFFITGTDTGVGKTVVTACLLSLYRRHQHNVGVMKPIETGVDPECNSAANSDAKFLMEVSQCSDPLSHICPIQLKTPASPYQASIIEDRSIDLNQIIVSFRMLADKYENLLVEGLGGLLVPLKSNYFLYDLIRDLGLPLMVVSRNTLGTLNHTLLTLRVAQQEGIPVRGIILNQTEPGEYTEIERGHKGIITELSGIPVLGEIPFLGDVSEKSFSEDLLNRLDSCINFSDLMPKGPPD